MVIVTMTLIIMAVMVMIVTDGLVLRVHRYRTCAVKARVSPAPSFTDWMIVSWGPFSLLGVFGSFPGSHLLDSNQ